MSIGIAVTTSTLCEWEHCMMGSKSANSPQRVAGEDLHQSLEGGGVDT